jgi:hypothetical protein
MATFSKVPGREAIEQEIGKRFEKIEKTLERTLEKTLKAALESPTAARAQAAAERAQDRISTARKSIDDVLLGLEHKGYNVKEPQDLIQTVGRRVLERASVIAYEIAEDVRSQVAAKSYSPEWLKNVSIPKPSAGSAKGAAAGSAAPVQAPGQTSVKVSKKSEKKSTVEAGATETEQALAADGEAMESAEDSKEERSAGTIVHAEVGLASNKKAPAKSSNKSASKLAKTKK